MRRKTNAIGSNIKIFIILSASISVSELKTNTMKFVSLNILSVLLAAEMLKAQFINECLSESAVWCVNDIELTKFDYNRELPFPDVKFFDKHCKSIKDFGECLLNKVKECDGKEPKSFRQLFTLAEHLCNQDSHLGSSYRENVACANSKKFEIDQCESRALEIVNKYRGYEKPGDKRYRILLCLEYMMSDKCTAEMLGDQCGATAESLYDEVSEFFREHVYDVCERKVVEIVEKKFRDLIKADLYNI